MDCADVDSLARDVQPDGVYERLLRQLRVLVSAPPRNAVSQGTRQRLQRLMRSAPRRELPRRLGQVTLAEVEDAGRPLLFSRLPRMLRGDGTTPKSLQALFRYIDHDHDQQPAAPVSRQRWRSALATSRRLALLRSARRQR